MAYNIGVANFVRKWLWNVRGLDRPEDYANFLIVKLTLRRDFSSKYYLQLNLDIDLMDGEMN